LHGVVQGEEITLKNYREMKHEAKPVIHINKQKAPFADVIIPLFKKNNQQDYSFVKLLCIQCRNVGDNHPKVR